MQTRACPSCSEVIPSDVDYCPFCGNATRESLENPEDFELSQAQATRVVQPLPMAPTTDSDGNPLQPIDRAHMCMMCYATPAPDGDYCAACDLKLNMSPEDWQASRSASSRRTWMIVGICVIALAIVLSVIFAGHPTAPKVPPMPAPAPAPAGTPR